MFVPPSRMRSRWLSVAVIALLAVSLGAPAASALDGGFPTRADVLARPTTRVVGTIAAQYRVCADAGATFDLRQATFQFDAAEGSASPVSIGKDCPARGTAIVGGHVTSSLPYSLTWEQVKADHDADGFRVEYLDNAELYDVAVSNVEDAFAPRTKDGAQQNSTARWLLDGAYLSHIRDDAIEDDDLLPGEVVDTLVDGTNRFLSARPSSGETYTNHGMQVVVRNSLIRMEAMPNGHSDDGFGHGSVFKWDAAAGGLSMSDTIIYLEELPHSSKDANAFPPGTYSNVTVVLGPRFDGDGDGSFTDLDYPVALPSGVSQTRDVSIWDAARTSWLATHVPGSGTDVPGVPSPTPTPAPTTPPPSPSPTPTPTPTPVPSRGDTQPPPSGSDGTIQLSSVKFQIQRSGLSLTICVIMTATQYQRLQPVIGSYPVQRSGDTVTIAVVST